MKKIMISAFLLIAVFTLTAIDVTFNCNMNQQITLGNFDPLTDGLDVPGEFNGWSEESVLTDADEDGIYTITVPDFTVDQSFEYKFRINFDWQNAEYPGGGNRSYTVLDGDNTLDHWYNDDAPAIVFVDVTFTLYDESGTYQDINVKGNFDDWLLHQAFDDGTNGDETAGDNIWTCIIQDIPNGNWNWGAIEDNGTPFGIWLIDGPDLQFMIDDAGTISGQTNYDIPVPPDELEQNVIVTFQIDMNSIGASEDGVFIAGSFNEWVADASALQDLDEDGIYTIELLFEQGTTSVHTYKYLNGAEWENIDDRNLAIDDSNPTMVLDAVYFNNIDPSQFTTQDVTVTFQVDMNVLETEEQVYVAGNFNNWTEADVELLDTDLDGIYSGEHLIPSGTYIHQEYKFINGTIWETGFGNRTFDIDDSGTTQILELVTFNNFIHNNLSSQDVNVTFNLDISVLDPAWYSNGVFMLGNVLPITDNAYDNPLTEGETGFFSTTLLFPAGSYKDVGYVYLREDSSTLWLEFPLEVLRTFTIDDSGNEQILNMNSWGELTSAENEQLQIVPTKINNYPNPFNPTTTIFFETTNLQEEIRIEIYNIKGQKVKTFPVIQSGVKGSVIWNGIDDNGKPVSSGIYFSILQVNGKSIATTKMMLLK